MDNGITCSAALRPLQWLCQAILGSLLLGLAIGCGSGKPTPDAEKSSPHPSLSRIELNALIDSLANKNKPPTKTANRSKPVYADDYDFREDGRVRNIAQILFMQSGEDLFWCVMEHLDDDRYSVVYRGDIYYFVGSIQIHCRNKAANDLEGLYRNVVSDRYWRQVRTFGSLLDLTPWYQQHKNIPLYKQQIEIGESVLKKLESLEADPANHFGPTEEERAEAKSEIKNLIQKLTSDKKPIIYKTRLIGED